MSTETGCLMPLRHVPQQEALLLSRGMLAAPPLVVDSSEEACSGPAALRLADFHIVQEASEAPTLRETKRHKAPDAPRLGKVLKLKPCCTAGLCCVAGRCVSNRLPVEGSGAIFRQVSPSAGAWCARAVPNGLCRNTLSELSASIASISWHHGK